VKTAWTALAILLALFVQSALSHVAPEYARVVDPFLLVLVYCGLTGGETHGMLAGAAAGWVQDVHFGGRVVGLSGLTKVLVGFFVGLAGTRFLLTGPLPRFLVVFGAALVDALLFERLALVFEIPVGDLSALGLFGRAALNAVAGSVAFEAIDRRARHEARP
jgi:rod shape-determining protein MreD